MAKKKDKAKPVEKKEPSLAGKKIVMLMTLGTPKRCFTVGSQITVGKDIPEESARGWLKSGAAELIRDLPAPTEIK